MFGVMKSIEPQHSRADATLATSPARTFWRVFIPRASPGITSSILMVFSLALGLFISPVLVGGLGDLIFSYAIAESWLRGPLSVFLVIIATVFLLADWRAFLLIASTLAK